MENPKFDLAVEKTKYVFLEMSGIRLEAENMLRCGDLDPSQLENRVLDMCLDVNAELLGDTHARAITEIVRERPLLRRQEKGAA